MPKGSKTCSKCGYVTGPRAYICPECNTPFDFALKTKRSKTTKFIKDFNWRELTKGETIKATGGPYYLTDDNEYIPMGHHGVFSVHSVDENGVIAYNKQNGYVHLWMQKDERSKHTQIYRTAHRMILLRQKVKV
jgi:hypothetical protein